MSNEGTVLALDYGSKRIGVALASNIARLAGPYATLPNDEKLESSLSEIIKNENVTNIVVGYPRGLQGQKTAQTALVEEFVSNLKQGYQLPIDLQDEALTSQKAELELSQRNKPYKLEDIDALSATYILEDWLNESLKRKV
jgi:putative Holliday junction resolvase